MDNHEYWKFRLNERFSGPNGIERDYLSGIGLFRRWFIWGALGGDGSTLIQLTQFNGMRINSMYVGIMRMEPLNRSGYRGFAFTSALMKDRNLPGKAVPRKQQQPYTNKDGGTVSDPIHGYGTGAQGLLTMPTLV